MLAHIWYLSVGILASWTNGIIVKCIWLYVAMLRITNHQAFMLAHARIFQDPQLSKIQPLSLQQDAHQAQEEV